MSGCEKKKTTAEQLKLKAGWSAGFWSEEIEAWRYETELISQSRPAERPPGHVA